MLAGIVVNNGIVLVDYINQLRRQGIPLYEAVEKGGRIRLRPVLMTALTTILGMTPLAFHRRIRLNHARQLIQSGYNYLLAALLLPFYAHPALRHL